MTEGSEGHLIDGRFELVERLGGGGMGLVWRARDIVLHRDVALKEVRPPDPELLRLRPDAAEMLRKRVLREAVSLARVSHPNVVTIHHIVSSSEVAHPWLVMELVPGGSFQDRLDRGPCTPTETAELGRGVLRALRAAHEAGILHRDVKPGNVLLRADGAPVLTDFGIAAVREATSLTNTGELIGSPDYMAPERLRGRDDEPSSDLWSLAMMLYAAVEGRHPMHRSSTLATLAAILEEDVPPPRRAGALGPVLQSVLIKDVSARPDAEALDRLLAEAAGERVGTVVAGVAAPEAPTDPRKPSVGVEDAKPVVGGPPGDGGEAVPVPEDVPVPADSAAGPVVPAAGTATGTAKPASPEPGGVQAEATQSGAANANAAGSESADGDAAKPADADAGDTKSRAAQSSSVPSPVNGNGNGKDDGPGVGDGSGLRTSPPHRPLPTRRRSRWLLIPTTLTVLAAGVLAWEYIPSIDDGKKPSSAASGSSATATPTPTSTPTPTPSSSPSPTPEPTKEETDLLTPAGARRVVREMKKVMGSTTALEFSLHPGSARAFVAAPDDEVYNPFSYRYRKGTKDKGGGLMNSHSTFDAARVNWDALPELVRVAKTELKLRKPKLSHVVVELSDGPAIRVYAEGEYGSAMLVADLDGNIIKRVTAR